MDNETIVRLLTTGSLAGLLLAVGMRLTIEQVVRSLREQRLIFILIANFAIVPALVLVAAKLCRIPTEITVGMMLLGAAPFAPVVPVFARMANANLALAAGLTALFPFLSAFLTPFVCELTLKGVGHFGAIRFNALEALLILVATIVVPLGVGMLARRVALPVVRTALRPMEVVSEGLGATSLAFVTITEWPSIRGIGWRPLLAMAVVSELCLLLGYLLGKPDRGSRQVIALGTSNRNIALALLLALQAFGKTEVVAAVVGNGLLLILLGLLHVAYWRWRHQRASE